MTLNLDLTGQEWDGGEHSWTSISPPVVPGEELTVHIWDDGGSCLFQTRVGDRVVLDRGVFTVKPA